LQKTKGAKMSPYFSPLNVGVSQPWLKFINHNLKDLSMSDSDAVLNVNTKEDVAYKLLHRIAHTEKQRSKKALLDLYAECLEATSGKRVVVQE
jgi:hypothetical protein